MKMPNKEAMEKGSAEKVPYIEIKVGDNIVRLVGGIHGVKEHRVEIGEGTSKRVRNIVCPHEMARWKAEIDNEQITDYPNCPLCEDGVKVVKQFMAFAVKRIPGKFEVGILKKGSTVFGPIQDYNEDTNWGDYEKYDFNLKAEGENLERKYNIIPTPKDVSAPLDEAELSAIKYLQETIDLEEMTKPLSAEDITKIMDGEDIPF